MLRTKQMDMTAKKVNQSTKETYGNHISKLLSKLKGRMVSACMLCYKNHPMPEGTVKKQTGLGDSQVVSQLSRSPNPMKSASQRVHEKSNQLAAHLTPFYANIAMESVEAVLVLLRTVTDSSRSIANLLVDHHFNHSYLRYVDLSHAQIDSWEKSRNLQHIAGRKSLRRLTLTLEYPPACCRHTACYLKLCTRHKYQAKWLAVKPSKRMVLRRHEG